MGIVVLILLFSPYILVPFLVTRLFKRLHVLQRWEWLTCIVTAVIILLYPYIGFKIADWLNPIKEAPHGCAMFGLFYIGIYWINAAILMPVSILIQTLFNYWAGAKYDKKEIRG